MLPLLYRTRRHGFTLVELLVVILILAILLSVALPLYTAAVTDAETKAARTNMATIASAVAAYRVRDPGHLFPDLVATLANPATGGGDIGIISGPGTRSYILEYPSASETTNGQSDQLGTPAVVTSTCWTWYNNNGTVTFGPTTIPLGSYAVTSTIGGAPQDTGSGLDGCYIPGVSVQ